MYSAPVLIVCCLTHTPATQWRFPFIRISLTRLVTQNSSPVVWPITLRHWADAHLSSCHTGDNAVLTWAQPWQRAGVHSIHFSSHQLKSSKAHSSWGPAPHFSECWISSESELSHKLSVLFCSTPPWALSGIYGAEQAFIGCHHTRSTSLSFGHGCAPNAILKAFWETIVDEQILLRKGTHPALGEIPLWTTLVHTHNLCSILPGTKGRYTEPNQPTERPTLVNGSLMFPQKRTQKLVIGQLLLWNKFYEQKD